MLHLLLVRHGESSWNALGRWQGQADAPLSDRGRQQAHAAVTGVASTAHGLGAPVRAVVTSTLDRALTTAAILGEALDVLPLYLEADFIERDAGAWSGLTRDEIDAQFPDFLASGLRPPDYEPDASLRLRVLAAIDRTIARFAPTPGDAVVVVVTHGGVIYALEGHLGAPFERKPNLGARLVSVVDGQLRLGPTVELLDAGATTTPDLL